MKVFAVRREKLAATGSQLFIAAFQFLGELWPCAMGFGTIHGSQYHISGDADGTLSGPACRY